MITPFRHRRLGYLSFNVTDIDKATQFATDVFGLDLVTETADGSRFFRGATGHQDIVLAPASQAAFVRSAWELELDADLDIAFSHYRSIGLEPYWINDKECGELRLQRGFRVVDPVVGATWEYFAEMTHLSVPRKNHLTSFQGGKHFGLLVPNYKAATDYLLNNMGFLMSDYFEGHVVSLIRAWPNPNHHSLAILDSHGGQARFHHLAFMVETIDDIGRLFNRVEQFGVQIQFGIGRHPTSGSIHLYVYGPDLFVWEYTLGMEQFAAHDARPPRRFALDPAEFDLWGAVPDNSRVDEFPKVLTSLSSRSGSVQSVRSA
jgi:2,3-dihydroxy-p-cumate/2,3-dihydroxybenzoate 3,4-dioxygenase